MPTNITGGNSRPKTNSFFIHPHAALRAQTRVNGQAGLLSREDLRHLVAEMVD